MPEYDHSAQLESVEIAQRLAGGRQEGAASGSVEFGGRLWSVLGAAYILIGLTEFVCAALWHFWVGMAVGLGVAKLGLSLVGLGHSGKQTAQLPPSGLRARLKAALWALVRWGSNLALRLLYYFRWLVFAYGALALLMLLIHLASPDPRVDDFPAACPPGTWFGCSRVAEEAPHATRRMLPLPLNTSMEDAQAAAERWVGAQSQSRILLRRTGFIHARLLTWFWGFADDWFASFSCNEEQQVVVEVQGQLRLGKSDLGVNARRNQQFLLALSKAARAGEIPAGQCMLSPGF